MQNLQDQYLVFATVGNATQPFDRFVQMIESAAATTGLPVLVQTGTSSLVARDCDCVSVLKPEEFKKYLDSAAYIVTHAGEGSVMAALEAGKRPIVVARQQKYGEHVNDHQLDLVAEFVKLGLVREAKNTDQLVEALCESPPEALPKASFSNTKMLAFVDEFLAGKRIVRK